MYDRNPYSGTMYLMTTGYHKVVWESFKVAAAGALYKLDRILRQLREQGFNGTDSAWIGKALGPGQPTWGQKEGLYSLPWDLEAKGLHEIPKGARIILLHGRKNDPMDPALQMKYPWIKEHWR